MVMDLPQEVDIGHFFDQYQWSYEQLEASVWRSSIATDEAGDFDLYVMVNDQWVYFAISPFVPRPTESCQARVHQILLLLNQRMRLANFGLDEDGDVNLLIELPCEGFSFSLFEKALHTLTQYTESLALHLSRLATEPGFHSPLLRNQ